MLGGSQKKCDRMNKEDHQAQMTIFGMNPHKIVNPHLEARDRSGTPVSDAFNPVSLARQPLIFSVIISHQH